MSFIGVTNRTMGNGLLTGAGMTERRYKGRAQACTDENSWFLESWHWLNYVQAAQQFGEYLCQAAQFASPSRQLLWSESIKILSTLYLLRVVREGPSEPDQFQGPSRPHCLFSDCKKLDTSDYHEFTFS